MIRVGELFAGIGGIGLGLEMAGGFEVAWQVERETYAQKVLAKNWPGIPLHDDVKTFPPDNSDKWKVDMIAGGFPCQDISAAGKGAGLDGDRSGLFYEIIRIAGVLRPRYILLENVPALLTRGLSEVLRSLAESGYDAQWRVLSAAEMGAPHLRKRIFIFATLADTDHASRQLHRENRRVGRGQRAKASSARASRGDNWSSEPDLGRVAHGVPSRVDRLRCLGNAVVPQCVAWLADNWILPAIKSR